MWRGDQLDELMMDASRILRLVECPGSCDAATLLVTALALGGELHEDDPSWTVDQLYHCWIAQESEHPERASFHD